MNDRMNIAISLNQNYFVYTYVMLTSLFVNHQKAELTVYVLHSELTREQIEEFQRLAQSYGGKVDSVFVDRTELCGQLPTTAEWTVEMYYRLMMPDLLPPDVERILYLDVDVIVNKSLRGFYHQDLGDKLFCVCKDVTELKCELWQQMFGPFLEQGFAYFNSGVMLWNLKEIRKQYNFAYYMRVAKELDYKLVAPDQDLLNYCHWQQVKYADAAVYNQFARVAHNAGKSGKEVREKVAVLHFAGTKPWGADNAHFDIEKIWWDYARMTPYFGALCEDFVERTMTDTSMEKTLRDLLNHIATLEQNLSDSLQLNQKLLEMISPKSTS